MAKWSCQRLTFSAKTRNFSPTAAKRCSAHPLIDFAIFASSPLRPFAVKKYSNRTCFGVLDFSRQWPASGTGEHRQAFAEARSNVELAAERIGQPAKGAELQVILRFQLRQGRLADAHRAGDFDLRRTKLLADLAKQHRLQVNLTAIERFVRRHRDAGKWLANWVDVATAATWRILQDIRKQFPSADGVRLASRVIVTIFSVKGNEHRLLTIIHYAAQRVVIWDVLTHEEYDRESWK